MDSLDTSFGSKRIAMLIDGENAQSSLIDKMVAETGKYGLGHRAAHLRRFGPPAK